MVGFGISVQTLHSLLQPADTKNGLKRSTSVTNIVKQQKIK
jgi:hypothetical protein